jgi:hypothetical protein
MTCSFDELKIRLARSAFRSRFKLSQAEKRKALEKGREQIFSEAKKIIRNRLGAVEPENDGRQTPMRGHSIFIAQHATGCCCRGCLAKWQGIPRGKMLSEEEVSGIAQIITAWIFEQCSRGGEDILYTPDLW